MSEEESDSSSPDKDIKSESLSNQNSKSLGDEQEEEEDQPYENNVEPRETPNIYDKNKEYKDNEEEIYNPELLGENDDIY